MRILGVVRHLAVLLLLSAPGWAQKRGGTMIVTHIDNPPSASIHEESTSSVIIPFMSVFNNLVMFDQHQPQNRMDTIVPELATSWKWNDAGTALTFALREGVRWHDGMPFTSADVKCTWEMISGLVPNKIRRSPHKEWYGNLDRIETRGDREVTFHLKRAQPSFLALLAAGWSPVYPCHIPSAQMRTKPVGTGP
jgi:peptide/nickel transport system substrate-binding protein